MKEAKKMDKRTLWSTRFSKLHQRHIAPYFVISKDPVVLHIPLFPFGIDSTKNSYKILFDFLKEERVYLVWNWGGYAETKENILQVKSLQRFLLRTYKRFQFIHLCNTKKQLEMFEDFGLRGIFCNHNCFVDERIFYPLQQTNKKFDALYDSRLSVWKRHDLAKKVENLALLFYFIPGDDKEYINQQINFFSDKAHLFNLTKNNEYKKLNTRELNKAINSCKTGLCLSEEEGAMYASMQYLLCGLPVVTTPSRGGRDVFFDEEYVETVEPDPDAVKNGVKNALSKEIPQEYIRQKTLEKIQIHRNRFIDLIQSIYKKEGKNKKFEDEWDSIFFNKLLTNLNHFEVIGTLKKTK